MNILLRICSIFDIFSVSYSPSLVPNRNKSTYQSALGGIISLGIYGFILYYSIDLLMTWFKNEMVMKVSNQQEPTVYFEETFTNFNTSQTFQFSFFWNEMMYESEEIFDPFNPEEVIILPVVFNGITYEMRNILYFYTYYQLEIVLADSEINHGEYFFIFLSCIGNEQLLDTGQRCSSQEKADRFWKLTSISLIAGHERKIIDIYTKNIEEISHHTTHFLSDQGFFSQVNYQYSYTEIQSGFLFQESNNFLLKSSQQEQIIHSPRDSMAQYLSAFYGVPKFNNTMYGAVLISGWYTVNHTIAQYPAISEILASIGSVLQTILLIKYIIMFLNRRQMVENFKEVLKLIYFPDLQKIKRTEKGKLKEYTLYDQKIEQKSYKIFLKNIDNKLEEKLNYIILQQIVTKETIIKSHRKSQLYLQRDEGSDCYKLKAESKYQKDLSVSLKDSCFDPFLFNYSSGLNYSEDAQNNMDAKNLKSSFVQQQRSDYLISSEIQVELPNIPSLGSMRPQQSL